ncbi:hypothetical protein MMC08_006249 [Hypocenomyce scalaris]|nr:hypothetical protein [Hypocenomyce scalaris]
MGRPKRNLLATAEETSSPPASLEQGQAITRVVKADGNNLYSVELPNHTTLLVELPSRFRSTIWIKRGGYVVVDTTAFEDRANKLDGEIVNVVRNEKQWRKQAYWPSQFVKTGYPDDSEEELSTAGRMPPGSDSESAEESRS